MISSESVLFDLVKTAANPRQKNDASFAFFAGSFSALGPAEAGRTFATALFIDSVSQALTEHRWLLERDSRGTENPFACFLERAFARELTSVGFLGALWTNPSNPQLKAATKAMRRLASGFTEGVNGATDDTFRAFIAGAIERMAEYALRWPESPAPPGHLALSLDRTFDPMDQIFRLQFERDHGMPQQPGMRERLYEGAGGGVQTSYATILTALEQLRLPENTHLIDLGSGYGRVGLVAGLAHPSLRFTGYEYVGHRVEVAAAAAKRAGMADRVKFLEQDLSRADFEIPPADVYYLYDPFCAETYARVLARLHSIGANRSISVVTHCDAGAWFATTVRVGTWRDPEIHDGGTLRIFRSVPA